MSRKTISVVKKANKKQNFPPSGTYPSLHNNNLLLTSTGIPSFDNVLGGGIPLGSVLLIEEDLNNRFSKLMTKYFLAEGVACKHGLCVVKEVSTNESLLNELPKLIPKDINVPVKKLNDDMKIAFRYKDPSTIQKTISNVSKQGHYYDITKKMESMKIDECDCSEIIVEDFLPSCWDEEDIFKFALTSLKNKIQQKIYTVPEKLEDVNELKVCRIVIPSFGSPFWCANNSKGVKYISRFLLWLRGLVRKSMTVCVVSIPCNLYTDKNMAQFRHLADCAVKLKSFAGEKKNPLFKQYHGLFKIKKLPCLNSLVPYVPQTLDLAFELKRTKFVIEYLHLPPDIGENASRQGTEEVNIIKSSPCGGGFNSKLDF